MVDRVALENVPSAGRRGWLTTWRVFLVASVVLLLAHYIPRLHADWWTGAGIFDGRGEPMGGDYVNIWTAARLVLDGRLADVFDDAFGFHVAQEQLLGRAFQDHNWSYPPHLVPFILVFGMVPYVWGYVVWIGGTFAAYAAAALSGRARKPALLLGLLLAPATFANVLSGQNGFVTAALTLGALRLLDRHPAWAGVLLGLLTVKPQLGILIPVALIAAGAWRAILSAAVTTSILIAGSVALLGSEPWIAYLHEIRQLQIAIMERGTGPFTLMMPTPFMAARVLGWDISIGYWLNLLSALAAAATVAWAYRARSLSTDLRAAILLTATLLASPYAFNYDMTALSAVLLCMIAVRPDSTLRHGELLALIAAWSLPVAVLRMNDAGLPLGPLVLAAMLLYLVLRARDEMRAGAPHPAPSALSALEHR